MTEAKPISEAKLKAIAAPPMPDLDSLRHGWAVLRRGLSSNMHRGYGSTGGFTAVPMNTFCLKRLGSCVRFVIELMRLAALNWYRRKMVKMISII